MPTSVLSDGTIRRLVDEGRIRIEPWDPGMVQPASVDLRLGRSFRVFHNHRAAAIDLRDPPTNLTEHIVVEPDEAFVIHPREFVLRVTQESVSLPDHVGARIARPQIAAETAKKEGSHTAFYIAGGMLAAWAVIVSALGISTPGFPGTKGGRAAVITLSVLLVLAATSTAVITAG